MDQGEGSIKFDRKPFSDVELLQIYRQLLVPRLIEDRMLILLRQGKLSKWFSGFGQEATSVGCVLGLKDEELIFPMHRNLGMFTARGLPLARLFAQFQGKMLGYTKGRDRSFHFGDMEHNIVGMISHLGPQLGLACGAALADKLANKQRCTLVVTGDGGASEGDFHEALNVASVWRLPVIFMVENNQWGLSTPSSEQFNCKAFIDKGPAYGMKAVQVDGNNILEVISTVRSIAEEIRNSPQPVLLESITFRMRGHEESSGTKYYPEGLQEKWSQKDPIEQYEQFLIGEGILAEIEAEQVRSEITDRIKDALEIAKAASDPVFDKAEQEADLFAPAIPLGHAPLGESRKMRFIDAISDALKLAMRRHDKLILMGQDIADYGGVFKVTEGFVEEFGKLRVRNTPLCESAILGAAIGLSLRGYKSMVEMQFADFVSEGMTQICNNMAKLHWRWGQNVDVVIRMPTGAGTGAGPFHSQSNEAWFFHIPGLKIVYPSNPEDAKGLLLAAFEDPNPVLFFEHKVLYRVQESEVRDGFYTTAIGKAKVLVEGSKATIITYGMSVCWVKQYLDENSIEGVELLDLRSLAPLDTACIIDSVKKTGRVLIVHEDNLTGGIGAELSALIVENCFEYLDGPVLRCASYDIPIPFNPVLEKEYLANARLGEYIDRVLTY